MAYKYLNFFLYYDLLPIIMGYLRKKNIELLIEKVNLQIKFKQIIKDIKNINFIMKVNKIDSVYGNIKKIKYDMEQLNKIIN